MQDARQEVPKGTEGTPPESKTTDAPQPRPNIVQTARSIIAKDGWQAFWRGIGPALALVINPIIQYTVFEQVRAVCSAINLVAILSYYCLSSKTFSLHDDLQTPKLLA